MSQLGELGFRTSGRVKHRRGRGGIAVIVALIVIAVGGYFAATKGREVLSGVLTVEDYQGTGTGAVNVVVEKGASTREIASTLEEKGVVKSAKAFEQAARNDPRSTSIQPGNYRMRKEMSGVSALALILDPNAKVLNRVTIPEGMRLTTIIDLLSAKSKIPKSDFDAVLKDPSTLGLPAYAKGRVEGFLFPATYEVDPSATAESLLQAMVGKYNQVAKKVKLDQGAKRLGVAPRDVLIIASIVEAEVRLPGDYAKASSVVYNRLKDPMKLRLDSTVLYALNAKGKTVTTPKDRKSKSRYNTYMYFGLPAGPIGNPGLKAIEGALHPAGGKLMFWTTINFDTGQTLFAETAAGHDANVKKWRAWCNSHKGRCR